MLHLKESGNPVHIENQQQLVEYLESGCKPESEWCLGTEHEKFGFTTSDMRPLPYEGKSSIRAMLQGLTDQFGWKPVKEQGKLIALLNDTGASVTLEPGGQLELSGALLDNIHQTCDEVYTHLEQVKTIAEPLGIAFSVPNLVATRATSSAGVVAFTAQTVISTSIPATVRPNNLM